VPAVAMSVHDQSDRAASRMLRPAILLLIVAIHAALLLLASRRVTRVSIGSEEPLVFLALSEHAQVPTPAASVAAAPRKKPVAPRDTQLVVIPAPAPPAGDRPPVPIDWNAEAERAIKQHAELAMATPSRALDQHGAGADLNGGLGPDRKQKSEFAWDRKHTQRLESIEGGGILLHLSDHCVLLVFPLPFVGCGIGKIPARGDLFEHMHDEPQTGGNPKNIVP
jgi:hypothetical protein